MEKINKSLLSRLKKLTNQELLLKAQVFKILNMNMDFSSNNSFQKNYETILSELKLRGLLK
jgi:hypothetical protein